MRTIAFCGIVAALSGQSLAGLSQSQITPPGGFIQAIAAPATTGSVSPGLDISSVTAGPRDFHEAAFTLGATASQSAFWSEPSYQLSAQGSAGMGFVRGQATRNSPSSAGFSLGAANGGWKEAFTISHPALTGQNGTLVIQVRARGHMEVNGFNGSAAVTMAAYRNDVELGASPYYNPGNSDPTGLQRGHWGVSSFGPPDERTVDGVVTMGVPFTFGEPFTLGVYAIFRAGHRSQATIGGNSTASADFDGFGVTWAGIASIRDPGGAIVSGFTIESGSGINWTGPVGDPCRADLTAGAVAGQPGYGVPNGTLNNDDFFYYLAQFAAGNVAVADMTTGAVAGQPGYGIPNGVINNDDFFYYLVLFAAGC